MTVRAEDEEHHRRLFVLGRIQGSSRDPNSLRGHLATAFYGGRVLDQTSSDGTGRFLLEFTRDLVVEGIDSIDLYVTTPSGARIGARRIGVVELDSPQLVVFFSSPSLVATKAPPVPTLPTGHIKHFTANGEPHLLVDSSCSEVLLEWEIQGGGDLQILLADGKNVIDESLPPRGSQSIRARKSAEYTLLLRKRTQPETTLERWTLTVKRFPTLSLYYYYDRAPERSQPLQVGAAISCPAPEKGLPVMVVSSDQARLGGGNILIRGGEVWGEVSLSVGAKGGEIELTGMAPGYLRDSVRVMVTDRS